jgi:vancomycin resistance protein YoaR
MAPPKMEKGPLLLKFWYNTPMRMISTSPLSRTPPPSHPSAQRTIFPWLSALAALAGGLLLFLTFSGISLYYFEANYDGKVYPGVTVAGHDLSGLTPAEASSLIASRMDYSERGRIVFQEGESIWIATPGELGLRIDSLSSAQVAYQVGRNGGYLHRLNDQFLSWWSSIDLSPLFVYDERVAENYLKTIAAEIDRPVVEASLSVSGTDVLVVPGQIGLTLDVPSALAEIQPYMQLLNDGLIHLVVHQTPPAIMDVSEQAEIVRKILSEPLTIQVAEPEEGDPGPWVFQPEELVSMLAIERVETEEGAVYQVGLNSEQLRPLLESAATQLARDPLNARFIFNDDTRQLEVIQSGVIGRVLDVDASIQTINQLAAQGEHSINLQIVYNHPQAGNSATAEDFGITELVASHTSYFFGSSAGRIQNIQTASSRFHGVMVPPGATFSMVDVLGNISLDDGYTEALIIYGGRTIQGVGGGVCQVSTTLFRTAFLGGFPIVERHPHAYRVGYYEQTTGGAINARWAGLDATVYVPVVDFKFRNDSPHWLLMETYVNAAGRSLTWKFYSTSDGRSVAWETTGLQNVVKAPPPLYEESSQLKSGEIKQVDWAADGADITVTRTVTRGGEVIINDRVVTNYRPWRAVYQYGPGTPGMPPDGQEESGEE